MQENVTTDNANNRPIGLDLDRDDWDWPLNPTRDIPTRRSCLALM
jgi:hypothetical protein